MSHLAKKMTPVKRGSLIPLLSSSSCAFCQQAHGCSGSDSVGRDHHESFHKLKTVSLPLQLSYVVCYKLWLRTLELGSGAYVQRGTHRPDDLLLPCPQPATTLDVIS